MKRVVGVLVLAGMIAAGLGLIRWEVVLAPLLGVFIFMVGTASLGSLRRGADHIPDGPPEPVDIAQEQVSYLCTGCGAELLLLVRGSATPPRHCGERMHERREVRNLG